MTYSTGLSLIVFGDIMIIFILSIVISFSCYLLIRRFQLDYNIIRNLTSNNRILPIQNVEGGIQTIEGKVLFDEPYVPQLPN